MCYINPLIIIIIVIFINIIIIIIIIIILQILVSYYHIRFYNFNPSIMNGMKMKKSFGKTHSAVQLLLILWMTSLIHIAVGGKYICFKCLQLICNVLLET